MEPCMVEYISEKKIITNYKWNTPTCNEISGKADGKKRKPRKI